MKYATFTSGAVADIQQHLKNVTENNLFADSLKQLESQVQDALKKPLDVPGQGEAGSYEHNQHKFNYELMDQCAKLYVYSHDRLYFNTIRILLLKYADVYLNMPFHEQKNTNPPGRLFHQILNEHMWLFYASLAYSVIKNELNIEDRQAIEDKLFHPMIDMFTVLYGHDFDRIHNHGIWAVAAVGLCALNVGNAQAFEQSVYGLKGDSQSGGFLAQISGLFSRSGYYIEGPYYHRFAIRPLVIFAEALHLHLPDIDIYNYNDGVIGKTIKALLLTSNPDGTFPALNDASLTMNINDEGALAALSVYVARYGQDETLVAAARQQGQVWLSPCSLALSEAAHQHQGDSLVRWPSIELTEGLDGEKGAQGFLRSQATDKPVTQAIMTYGQHGMGHGHFDCLGITLFGHGHEFLREYGFGRWVNVETKFGGRYLDENKSWARQTIAHNTVTVDRKTQNNFDSRLADTHFGKQHFFEVKPDIQAMSAFANEHYDGVEMQRTIIMLEHPDFEQPLLIDLYRLSSTEQHDYDLAVHYLGQVTDTNLDWDYHCSQRNVLGDSNGYQHLFEKARASAKSTSKVTWLQDDCFHTWTTEAPAGDIVLAQTGANDPAMNLRSEDCILYRTQGRNALFVSTYETHGLFDEASERCYGAINQVESIQTLHNEPDHSVVTINYRAAGVEKSFTLAVSNNPECDDQTQHAVTINSETLSWTGYFTFVEGDWS